MTEPGSYWATDTPISMPEPAKDNVLMDFGAIGFGINGVMNNLSQADLENYTQPTFGPIGVLPAGRDEKHSEDETLPTMITGGGAGSTQQPPKKDKPMTSQTPSDEPTPSAPERRRNTPPTASFGVTCTNLVCTFTGAASVDPDGSIVNYTWDFGDGFTGSGVTPTHSYASAGTYPVTLTVTDNKGATGSVTIATSPYIPPTASFSSSVTNLACTFDASGSSDADGSIVSYGWDFGDGATGSGVSPSHTYASAGTYSVTLTVTDNGGNTDTVIHSVTATSSPPANLPPIAAFTKTHTNLVCNFNASGSSDPDGSIVSYAWTFGDGGTGTGVTPTHTYATAGTYPVTLTVTDNLGATAFVTHNVKPTAPPNVPPVSAFTSTVTNLTAVFDASTSSDPDGTIASYSWDFGDGTTGTGVNPSHTYSTTGSQSVTLTVTDNQGATNSVTHTIITSAPPSNQPPIADFTFSIMKLTIIFDGSGSTDPDGSIVSYAWDFGDGNTGTGISPSHTYAAAGNYTVALTVTDNQAATTSVTHTVTAVANVPPTAAFTFTPTYLTVAFDGSGSTDPDGTIVGYAWTFGDGATGIGVNPSYTYASAGTRTVTLTVTDNDGSTGVVTHAVVTTAPPNVSPNAAFTSSVSGLTCSFNGTGSNDPDGSIASYSWNFGDGVIGVGATPSHTYYFPGPYNVTLTVTDNQGATGTITHIVNPVSTAKPIYGANVGGYFSGTYNNPTSLKESSSAAWTRIQAGYGSIGGVRDWPGSSLPSWSSLTSQYGTRSLIIEIPTSTTAAQLGPWLASAPTDRPIWWVYQHEPEGKISTATFKANWKTLGAVHRANSPENVRSAVVLQGTSYIPSRYSWVGGVPWSDWYPTTDPVALSYIDDVGADVYHFGHNDATADTASFVLQPVINAAQSLGKGIIIPEYGLVRTAYPVWPGAVSGSPSWSDAMRVTRLNEAFTFFNNPANLIHIVLYFEADNGLASNGAPHCLLGPPLGQTATWPTGAINAWKAGIA